MRASLASSPRLLQRLLALGLTLVLALCASACATLDAWQRQKIYRPTPSAAPFVASRAGDERYLIPVPPSEASPLGAATPQVLELWWLPQADAAAPALLYLHGTFRNLSENRHKIDALRDAGFAVLAVDYRGWGLSSPIIPSERSIMQDTRLAWAELTRRQPQAARRVIYGHSMGSGAAVALAAGLDFPGDYAGLILESAFSSFADVAQAAGLLPGLLFLGSRERFDSIGQIGKIRAPLLMLHGGQDDTIPSGLGRRLFEAAAQPKQWLLFDDGAHSDLDLVAPQRYRNALADFRQRYLSAP